MLDLTPQLLYALVACGVMLLVGFPVHEWSHAFAAWRLGDATARWQGRLSLDPRVHLDRAGAFLLVITTLLSGGTATFGYARPTPVNPANLRRARHGEALVALAGPAANLVMAAVVALPLRFLMGADTLYPAPVAIALNVALFFVIVNCTLAVFNLLPIPPLDGWKVLGGLVPPRTAWQLRELEARYANVLPFAFLIAIILLGPPLIAPIVGRLLDLLLGGPAYLVPVVA
ncbi:MAG: site-2 protease family protein [Chloroflexota bacterium]